jgi:hypothetical protein
MNVVSQRLATSFGSTVPARLAAHARRVSTPAALALLLLTVAACGGGKLDPAPIAKPPVDVRVARTALVPTPEWYDAGGIVQAQTSATLTSRILAPVMAIRVQPATTSAPDSS